MSKCCFCGKEIEYKVNGNDPRPIRVKGEEMPICCNECNARIVVPTRVAVWGMEKELKAKLAEKDSAEQSKYQNVLELTKMCTEKDKKIEQLKQQLAEKEKEIEDLKEILEDTTWALSDKLNEIGKSYQEKIEFAINELKIVKNYVDGRTFLANYLNKRIEELKKNCIKGDL